ncbi:MAG: GNAT family N-acetyltransferase [Pseudomonadales bacterium]|nr:GNAT family N-acetyltransferase [Pseudomonadales bacterium]
MIIRKEQPQDIQQIYSHNAAAFPSEDEAQLINSLRETATPFISLVAAEEKEIKGHILFTPVTLNAAPELTLLGLAPMAVSPDHQNQGIGSQLVQAGLAACRLHNAEAIVVLGHPEFYPRFGFSPSVNFGIKSEYDVADEVFMILELKAGALKDKQGIISFHPAFAGL